MATPEQNALLPKMTGSDGTTTANAVGPVQSNAVNTQPPAQKAPAPQPPPPAQKAPAPDFASFWVDAYGNVWRKLPTPTVILSITGDCTQQELDTIINALLKGNQ